MPAQAVGGNTALALLLVIATNVAGIFTMPFVLAAVLRGGGSGVALAPVPLLRQLLQSILAPLLIGVSARALVPGARRNVFFPVLQHALPAAKSSERESCSC